MIKNIFRKSICFTLSASFLSSLGNIEISTSAENIDIWNGTYDTSWYSSYENEFHISTPEQFAGVAQIVNSGNDMSGKTIYLDEDIYLNDISEYENWGTKFPENIWKAVGISDENCFNGTFNGCGNTIYGLYINSSDYEYIGLFGYCKTSSCIENLTSENSFIKNSRAESDYTGGIAALTYGIIENCENNGRIYVKSGYEYSNKNIYVSTGGIAGNSFGSVENCRNKGEISASELDNSLMSCFYTGGIVGNSSSEIENCINYSDIMSVGSRSYAGGICGLSNKKINLCVNNGRIESKAKKTLETYDIKSYAGGIAGSSSENIENSVNNGEIYAEMAEKSDFCLCSGGISGYMFGSLQLCTNNADIYADDGENSYSGGILGKFDGKAKGSSIEKSFNIGNVSGGKYIGGISGYSTGGLNICSNKGEISSKYDDSFAGGITGVFESTSQKNSYIKNTCNKAKIKGNNAGGIIGYNIHNLSLSNTFNVGKIYVNKTKSDILAQNGNEAVLDVENVYCLEKNSTDSDKITALSEDEMKKESFLESLGEYFTYVENDFPEVEYENNCTYISIKIGEKYDLKKKFVGYDFEIIKNDSVSLENGVLSGISEDYSIILAKNKENNNIYIRINVVSNETPEITETTTELPTETTKITSVSTNAKTTFVSTTKTKISTNAKTTKISSLNLTQTTTSTDSDSSKNDNLGDVTNDGKVDSKDAVLILKKYAQSIVTGKLTGMSYARGDVNKDGKINSKDAVLILKYYAATLAGSFNGKIAEFVGIK
ncbi:MAG: dockerin type I repeat-containing protein [Oscillospiraceae bacterium]|nr:dockerin type I repeat-containing protein [Oscillospiraceae bacterium]